MPLSSAPLLLLVSRRSFSYLRLYRTDVRFDNVYVTAHFRRIDARRKNAVTSLSLTKLLGQPQAPPAGSARRLRPQPFLTFLCDVGLQGRRGLLPLRRSEKKKIIDLHSLKIHAEELQQVVGSPAFCYLQVPSSPVREWTSS